MKAQKRTKDIVVITVLLLVTLVIIIPFWWMVSTSLDRGAVKEVPFPPQFWPQNPSLYPYRIAFTNVKLLKYIFNTFQVVLGTILVSGVSALLAGYAMSKIKFKGWNFVLMASLAVLMIPFEMVMIPQYLILNAMGLTNTYFSFWLPGLCYVFGTFFAKQYMDSIPDTLREAAMLDGANELKIFGLVYLPLCGPVLATLAVMLFLGSWNDLLWPLIVLSNNERFTVQVGIAMFAFAQGGSGSITQMPAIRMAASVISLLPVLIVYMFLQRYIVESIALTGIKQ